MCNFPLSLLPSKRMGLTEKVAGGTRGETWRSLRRLTGFVLERSKSYWWEKTKTKRQEVQGRRELAPAVFEGGWGLGSDCWSGGTCPRAWHVLIHLIFSTTIGGNQYLSPLYTEGNRCGAFGKLTWSHTTKNWRSWGSHLSNVTTGHDVGKRGSLWMVTYSTPDVSNGVPCGSRAWQRKRGHLLCCALPALQN